MLRHNSISTQSGLYIQMSSVIHLIVKACVAGASVDIQAHEADLCRIVRAGVANMTSVLEKHDIVPQQHIVCSSIADMLEAAIGMHDAYFTEEAAAARARETRHCYRQGVNLTEFTAPTFASVEESITTSFRGLTAYFMIAGRAGGVYTEAELLQLHWDGFSPSFAFMLKLPGHSWFRSELTRLHHVLERAKASSESLPASS